MKALKTLRLDEEVIEWVKRALLSSHGDEQRFHGEAIARFHKQYEQLQRRIEVAYEDRLDGKIPMELFERKSEEWRAEQKRILREIERHQNADESYMAEGIALM